MQSLQIIAIISRVLKPKTLVRDRSVPRYYVRPWYPFGGIELEHFAIAVGCHWERETMLLLKPSHRISGFVPAEHKQVEIVTIPVLVPQILNVW
jgi:hypothetical protein